ncbi:MAG: SPASM domain-containing protein [Candidatus Aminicenantes bacterium]|nr:SPASM domain-containing protein [Candidatus Aminicenantes bacterium]
MTQKKADTFRIVLLETMRACTRRCPFCAFGQKRPHPQLGQVMPMALLQKIAAELRQLSFRGRISPYCINEPLLDERIVDIVRLFRSACPHAFISITSNGDLLNDRLHAELEKAGLDRLALSIYDDQVLVRLKNLISRPRIAIIDMRPGHGKLENRGGSIHGEGNRFHLKPGSVAHLPCRRPGNMIVVQPNGQVVLCCSDMYGEQVLGDAQRQSLVEIWQSERFVQIRQQLEHHRQGLLLCESCTHNGSTSPRNFPRKLSIRDIVDWIGDVVRRF